MPAIFLPFDQAALYNIVAELLAGETIGWLKQRRLAKKDYVRQVAEDTVANAVMRGITVEMKPLVALLSDKDFWDELNVDAVQALRLHLTPLIALEDNSSQDEAAALLAAELVLSAVRCLPLEQRVQVNQLNHLQSVLDNVHLRIQELQAEIATGFSAVVELLRADNPVDDVESVKTERIALSPWSKSAATICLTQLLRLQYPWGEWSDRRTELESIIAGSYSPRAIERAVVS